MADEKSSLDGILEEERSKPKETTETVILPRAGGFSEVTGQSWESPKPEATGGPFSYGLKNLQDDHNTDVQHLHMEIKKLEAMVMALRGVVGVVAVLALVAINKVRKLEKNNKALTSGNGKVIDIIEKEPAYDSTDNE